MHYRCHSTYKQAIIKLFKEDLHLKYKQHITFIRQNHHTIHKKESIPEIFLSISQFYFCTNGVIPFGDSFLQTLRFEVTWCTKSKFESGTPLMLNFNNVDLLDNNWQRFVQFEGVKLKPFKIEPLKKIETSTKLNRTAKPFKPKHFNWTEAFKKNPNSNQSVLEIFKSLIC